MRDTRHDPVRTPLVDPHDEKLVRWMQDKTKLIDTLRGDLSRALAVVEAVREELDRFDGSVVGAVPTLLRLRAVFDILDGKEVKW